jgi:hypothetical protein
VCRSSMSTYGIGAASGWYVGGGTGVKVGCKVG